MTPFGGRGGGRGCCEVVVVVQLLGVGHRRCGTHGGVELADESDIVLIQWFEFVFK
jgi:hypothetical protein